MEFTDLTAMGGWICGRFPLFTMLPPSNLTCKYTTCGQRRGYRLQPDATTKIPCPNKVKLKHETGYRASSGSSLSQMEMEFSSQLCVGLEQVWDIGLRRVSVSSTPSLCWQTLHRILSISAQSICKAPTLPRQSGLGDLPLPRIPQPPPPPSPSNGATSRSGGSTVGCTCQESCTARAVGDF